MGVKQFDTRIQMKRDSATNWTSANPVLLNGEIIIVDTNSGDVRYKVGDGTKTYTQLPFSDESLIANMLSLDGGIMNGDINMNNHKITGLGAPVNPNDAVRQQDLEVLSNEIDDIIEGTTAITLPVANEIKLGGVKIGEGITVDGEGTISAESQLPSGGTPGQVLTKTEDGNGWTNPAGWSVENVTGAEVFNDSSQNNATGIYSHAEGRFTSATGALSHAEGYYSSAIGDYSHAEGHVTEAKDGTSHAEGVYTIANGNGQHVQGKYNIEDVGSKYAHIVGNGTKLNTRSNAHTLDWDGNAWFAGDVFVGGTGQSSGEKLMKEPTGTAGQYLGFTSDNTVGAVDGPETGLTQEEADERYLQLNSKSQQMIGGAGGLILAGGNLDLTNGNLTVSNNSGWNISFLNGMIAISNASGSNAIEYVDNSFAFLSEARLSSVATPVSDTDAANKAYVDSKTPTHQTITLSSSAWSSNSQTVTVSGVTADELDQLITPTPAIASQSAYHEAGIMCTNQGTNSLTFTCQTVPASNLTVYVVIQPLS